MILLNSLPGIRIITNGIKLVEFTPETADEKVKLLRQSFHHLFCVATLTTMQISGPGHIQETCPFVDWQKLSVIGFLI